MQLFNIDNESIEVNALNLTSVIESYSRRLGHFSLIPNISTISPDEAASFAFIGENTGTQYNILIFTVSEFIDFINPASVNTEIFNIMARNLDITNLRF